MSQQVQTSPAETAALRPLDDVRILDLSGVIGQYATRLLADLGADVIRVEPPAGSEARQQLPFYHDEPDLDKSLSFWYFNANKRSITLNLATADGRALFDRLLQTADVVVDGLPRGELEGLGFAYKPYHLRFPRLIWAEISGFGSFGPHSTYLSTDLVALAMSGVLTLSGWPDRAPTMLPGQQGYICASIHAAYAILLALLSRDATGRGQRVEVSMQEALSLAQETAMQFYDVRGEVRQRRGDTGLLPGIGTYECADGYVFAMVGAPGIGAPLAVLVQWMAEEGMAGDLMEEEWQALIRETNLRTLAPLQNEPQRLAQTMTRFAHVDELLRAFMRQQAKATLYEGGQRRRLLIGPVNSPKDLLEDKQLRGRRWYTQVPQPGLGASVTYPGPPFRFSEITWAIDRPAPEAGEHNRNIYVDEMHLTGEQLATLAGAGVI